MIDAFTMNRFYYRDGFAGVVASLQGGEDRGKL